MVAHEAVQLGGALGALRGEPADHLGRGAQRVVGAPGIDALGGEGEVEVLARPRRPGASSSGTQLLARGARIGGRLEHDQLAALDDVGQRARGVEQRPQVGLAVRRQRRRDADEHRVGLGQRRVVASWRSMRRQHGAQTLGRDVLDVGLAGLRSRATLRVVDVDARPRALRPRQTPPPAAAPRNPSAISPRRYMHRGRSDTAWPAHSLRSSHRTVLGGVLAVPCTRNPL